MSNGNYVVRSQNWDNGGVVNAGAVTWGNGTGGTVGAVSAANSLVGSTASDNVGSGGVVALSNGNYVVSSVNWDNGAVGNAGAVTWGNGTGGTVGVVYAANSLVGSTADDVVGNGGVTTLNNGNYVVRSTSWDNGAVANVGAVTLGAGATGTFGTVSAANSVLGTVASGGGGLNFSYDASTGRLLVGQPSANQVSLFAYPPEISLTGNGVSIADGDSTPTTTDHTDFGSAGVSGGTVVRTFTIANSGGTLTLSGTPKVAVSGTHAAEFTVTALPTSPVTAGGSTTFQVAFGPSALGLRTATLTIANDDNDEGTYDFAIQGTGTANNAPTDITLTGGRVADGAAINTTAGTFTATDADVGNTHTFTLIAGTGSTDNSKFSITGSTLKVAVAPVLADSTYSIRVRATDGAGAAFDKQFTVLVMAVLVNAGDYLIADRGPQQNTGVILVVTKTGAVQRIISTQLKDPYDIVVDAAGDFIVADYDYDPGFSGGRGSSLFKIHRQTGVHTRLVFGAPLVTPLGVKVESDGKLLVADADYGYSAANALTVPAGAVIRVNANGSSPTVLASGGNFFFLQGLALAPNGDIYVANFANGNGNFPTRIIKVDKTTGAQTTITTGGLTRPMGLAVESDGNSLVVVDVTAKKLIRVALPAGTQTEVSSSGLFIQPTHVTIEADGNYLVTDGKSSGTAGERRIYRVNKTTGAATILVSDGFFQQPRGVTLAQ